MEMEAKKRKLPLAKPTLVIANDKSLKALSTIKLSPQKSATQLVSQRVTQVALEQPTLQDNSNKPQISLRVYPFTQSQNALIAPPTSSPTGQLLYLMPNNRDIINQSLFLKKGEETFTKAVLEQKRRILHKEIERRRRDKINDWIGFLSKQVPDCASDRTKQGQSKGGILAKTAKYIQELRAENEKVHTLMKEKDEMSQEIERMRRYILEVESDNKRLKTELLQK